MSCSVATESANRRVPASDTRRGERLTALFVFAFLLFNYPLLSLFSLDTTLFGLPVLYLYLFCSWALVIAATARILRRRRD